MQFDLNFKINIDKASLLYKRQNQQRIRHFLKMSLQQIKDKYMNLLNEQQQSNESDNDQWEIAYRKMKKNRSNIISAQSISVNGQNFQNNLLSVPKMIEIKQKLGQCIQNLNMKESELQVANKKYNQSQMQLLKVKRQLKIMCKKNEDIEKLAKQKQVKFENEFDNHERQLKKIQIDNQIKTQQIQFYQNQIKMLGQLVKSKQIQILNIKEEETKAKKYKRENQRLRMDVQRLFKIIKKFQVQKILQQPCRNSMINQSKSKISCLNGQNLMNSFSISNRTMAKSLDKSLKGKHYIGKPLKNQKQFKKWCPQILINEVQYFLKSQHIAYNNKPFVQNLTKFIQQYASKQNEKVQNQINQKYRQMKSQQSRRNNHSLSIRQIRQSTLKLLNLNCVNPLKQNSLFNSKTSKGHTYKNRNNLSQISQKYSPNNEKPQNIICFNNSRINKENMRKYRTQLDSKKVTQNGQEGNIQRMNYKIDIQTQDLCKKLQNSLKMNDIVKKVY